VATRRRTLGMGLPSRGRSRPPGAPVVTPSTNAGDRVTGRRFHANRQRTTRCHSAVVACSLQPG
jgi:hypothetical protein